MLFNRFYNPDFDVNNLQFAPSSVFSTPAEISTSLRWIAIMSGRCSAIYPHQLVFTMDLEWLRYFLAGANSVQVCSAIYRNGKDM